MQRLREWLLSPDVATMFLSVPQHTLKHCMTINHPTELHNTWMKTHKMSMLGPGNAVLNLLCHETWDGCQDGPDRQMGFSNILPWFCTKAPPSEKIVQACSHCMSHPLGPYSESERKQSSRQEWLLVPPEYEGIALRKYLQYIRKYEMQLNKASSGMLSKYSSTDTSQT